MGKSLNQIVHERPFHDYADWWEVGYVFTSFMSRAILSQWRALHGNDGDFGGVKRYFSKYIKVVFGREAETSLVDDFAKDALRSSIWSGEFDAFSYAFYRSAFELIELHHHKYKLSLEKERRLFTKRVGKAFFGQLKNHLKLDLPESLEKEEDFIRLKENINQVGAFLREQGYLRDYFAFRFTLDVEHAGARIDQSESGFLEDLKRNGIAYALYEMGYPIILPSAVYLYHTIGEAQHHSSRIIEDLFESVGYRACETDDFDPTNFPPDRVVELWEIMKST